jgi:hypothetical protein
MVQTAWRGLRTNSAETAPDRDDTWLRGRTYAISFDRVWNASLELAQAGLRRWHLLAADDYEGVIQAEIGAARLRPATRITIRIGLGADAQTRVDAAAVAPGRRGDLGASTRAIAQFFMALDRALSQPSNYPV